MSKGKEIHLPAATYLKPQFLRFEGSRDKSGMINFPPRPELPYQPRTKDKPQSFLVDQTLISQLAQEESEDSDAAPALESAHV